MAKEIAVKKSVDLPVVLPVAPAPVVAPPAGARVVQIIKIIKPCYWHQHYWDKATRLPKDVVMAPGEAVSKHLEFVENKPDSDSDLL